MSKDKSAPYLHDRNLSLKEKWKRHMELKRQGAEGNGGYVDARSLNRWGPWVFLFLLCGAGGWGTVVTMPVMYTGGWEGWLLPARVLVAFLVCQVSVNWCLTRWVSSRYEPDLHGTMPADFAQPHLDEEERKGEKEGPGGLQTKGAVSAGSLSAKKNGSSVTSRVSSANHDHKTHDNNETRDNTNLADDESSTTEKHSHNQKKTKRTAHDGYSYKMHVAIALPTEDGHVQRKAFPYWSWAPCLMCNRLRPPRCHHCTLCRQCVLKRDHHCYLTGACIGVNNHRFFLALLFWGTILCLWGAVHMLPYTFNHIVPEYQISYFDFLPPVSLVRGLLGYISLVIVVLSLLFWMVLFFTVVGVGMLVVHTHMLLKGRTGFESDNGIRLTDTRSIGGLLRSVFGEYWWLNFLLPTHLWFEPVEDAVLWPHIKPC